MNCHLGKQTPDYPALESRGSWALIRAITISLPARAGTRESMLKESGDFNSPFPTEDF
jgi:hypothetical protein